MSGSMGTVLIADDEALSLELVSELLEDAGYQVEGVADGLAAWEVLQRQPERFDVILLDRMMPRLDGMALLGRIKAELSLRDIPVILQTAMGSRGHVLEGLRAGAYYYLTKPFDHDALFAIVGSAVADYRRYRELRGELRHTVGTLGLLDQGRFRFRSLDQARRLATLLANVCPDPDRVVVGLSELLVNAVEHGNLGLGYQRKSELHVSGIWEETVNDRMHQDPFAERYATVAIERQPHEVQFLISDQGNGFEWDRYLEFDPERAFDSHGRGIAIANMVSFDRLEYRGNGNQVLAVVTT